MKIGPRLTLMALAVLTGATAFAGDKEKDLDIVILPVYRDLKANFDAWTVSIRNPLGATKGTLQVSKGAFRSTLQVDIPHNTDTFNAGRFLVYIPDAPLNRTEDTVLRLGTPDGRGARLEVRGEGFAVGGDVPPQEQSSNPDRLAITFGSADATITSSMPGIGAARAPELPAAYLQFQSVTLGVGSAGLSDRAVTALQTYVCAGGNLIFLPSAKDSALNDPRWADYVPGNVVGHPQSVEVHPNFLGTQWQANTSEKHEVSFTVDLYTVKPSPFSRTWRWKEGVGALQKRVGIGSTVLAAFTPNFQVRLQSLDPLLVTGKPHFSNVYYSSSYTPSPSTVLEVPAIPLQVGAEGGNTTDPFKAKPPSLVSVVLTLLGYAIAVILAAALGQKMFKKGEIAWITTPILSLGFAGFFFSFASDLYQAKESRAVSGILVGSTELGKGYFMGNSQVFVPKGGKVDLHLKDVDYLVPQVQANVGMNDGSALETSYSNLNLSQTPTGFEARSVRVDNLAFLSYRFQQSVDVKDWFSSSIKLRRKGEGFEASGTLKNASPYDLTGVAVTVGDQQFLLGDVKRNSETKFEKRPCTRFGGPSPIAQLPDFTLQNRVALEAKMLGFTPGPQVGSVGPGHQAVNVAMDIGVGEVQK